MLFTCPTQPGNTVVFSPPGLLVFFLKPRAELCGGSGFIDCPVFCPILGIAYLRLSGMVWSPKYPHLCHLQVLILG